jgi:hypothetical protein
MSTLQGHLKPLLVRLLVITTSGLLVGYLFRGSSIFNPSTVAFQFTFNSITAALFYSTMKSSSTRNALVVALVWYLLSTLTYPKNVHMIVMYLVYVAAILAAVFFYIHLIRRTMFQGIVQRIVAFSLLTATLNGIVVIVLEIIWTIFTGAHFQRTSAIVFENFQLGALIGLGVGVGIQIAEYMLSLEWFRQFIEAKK